jgi:hypothetical protein
MLVNRTYAPHLRGRHRRVRFRLLNASTARVYNVGFADGRRSLNAALKDDRGQFRPTLHLRARSTIVRLG